MIGAGDTFSTGLLYKYIKEGTENLNKNLWKTMLFATAALVCTASGASDGVKNIIQIKQFLQAAKY